MARTTQEIYDGLVAKKNEQIPELSDSQSAEWRLWLWVFAYGVYLFELVLDLLKSDVENLLSNKQAGSLIWYIDKAKEFQLNDSLVVNSKGILSYAVIDEEKQIVKHASATEQDGELLLKVAKYDDNGDLVPLSLTNGEFLHFQRYIENVKFAGTSISITTLDADIINYDITVYYDPAYLPEAVEQAVIANLDAFRLELDYEGYFYPSDFVKAITSVPGVKTVKVNALTGTQGVDTEAIDVSYLVKAGYYNFDEAAVITMQNARL
ncbi:hypothetical protein [uncultured Draconibacterium sp.]|uniref:hypothetical protein n=1 Tax=uncultured Draconibacterium sp. TaxID=1573823 RepID=UPI0025F25EDC|nr:hypothetical protein [uncultured Draconibacterium sp.]